VLRSTFRHLSGIGTETESELWRQGIWTWSRFQSAEEIPGISSTRHERLCREIDVGRTALVDGDGAWFAHRLPSPEHWRMFPAFRRHTAFVDIETTGLSPYESMVTVVSVYDGADTRTFVAGDNLEELPAYLRPYQVLVTFNGLFFDVPFLRVHFPAWIPPPAHIDLRFALRRLGLRGGLKRIERALGLGDRTGVEGVDGFEAVRLWYAAQHGNSAALERLVRYNRADTENLKPLLEYTVRELRGRIFGFANGGAPSDGGF
jgi:uncharacterized protein YprB with RNaseH-like and TPR domain